MIARSQRCIPCRPPPSSPTRAMTAKPCATGWQCGTTAVIPPRKNPVQYHYDKTARIERMFCRPTGAATRFDRNIKNFIAAIALAAAVI